MRSNKVARGLFLAFVLVSLGACSSLDTLRQIVDPPRVTLADVKLVSAGLLEQRYRLSLRVQNPNSVSIPINGLDYVVNIGGNDFVSGVTASSFVLPANGEDLVQIDVSTNLLDSARHVYALLKSGDDNVDYSLSGNVKVDLPFVKSLPFSRSGQVDLRGLNGR
ncbi:MAG: LEA type 2 family protein [Gammaproteobacteria bacterium]